METASAMLKLSSSLQSYKNVPVICWDSWPTQLSCCYCSTVSGTWLFAVASWTVFSND